MPRVMYISLMDLVKLLLMVPRLMSKPPTMTVGLNPNRLLNTVERGAAETGTQTDTHTHTHTHTHTRTRTCTHPSSQAAMRPNMCVTRSYSIPITFQPGEAGNDTTLWHPWIYSQWSSVLINVYVCTCTCVCVCVCVCVCLKALS